MVYKNVLYISYLTLFLQQCTVRAVEDFAYWQSLAYEDIKEAASIKINDGVAKNVVIFMGDGMGPTTTTASRIYGKGEKGFLAFEKFPHMGALKTYNADHLIPDSASTASALFSGSKINSETGGVEAAVTLNDCKKSLNERNHLSSVLEWGQKAGKATGFVTNTRVTHATPSTLYAHYASRYWECEQFKPPEAADCEDIATQLIKNSPGKNFRVIMGGGRQVLVSNSTSRENDPIIEGIHYSTDGRDLIKDWQEDKKSREAKYAYISNNEELDNLNEEVDFVLGIFANDHMKLEWEREKGPKGMPSLTNMTEKALKVLMKNKDGFMLIIEGGNIDLAHHKGYARQALDETVEFSNAIERSLEVLQEVLDQTLVIVCSDHAHSLLYTGFTKRGANILEVNQKSRVDNVGYTSLLYGMGPLKNYPFKAVDGAVIREEPSNSETGKFQYSQQAGILDKNVVHSGVDVMVYAQGPNAHLFHRLHEETYVAFVVAYAAKIGPYEYFQDIPLNRSTKQKFVLSSLGFGILLLSLLR